jgi:hypothetical protein
MAGRHCSGRRALGILHYGGIPGAEAFASDGNTRLQGGPRWDSARRPFSPSTRSLRASWRRHRRNAASQNTRPPRALERQTGAAHAKLSFALGIKIRAKSWTWRSVADAKWSATATSRVVSCLRHTLLASWRQHRFKELTQSPSRANLRRLKAVSRSSMLLALSRGECQPRIRNLSVVRRVP